MGGGASTLRKFQATSDQKVLQLDKLAKQEIEFTAEKEAFEEEARRSSENAIAQSRAEKFRADLLEKAENQKQIAKWDTTMKAAKLNAQEKEAADKDAINMAQVAEQEGILAAAARATKLKCLALEGQREMMKLETDRAMRFADKEINILKRQFEEHKELRHQLHAKREIELAPVIHKAKMDEAKMAKINLDILRKNPEPVGTSFF